MGFMAATLGQTAFPRNRRFGPRPGRWRKPSRRKASESTSGPLKRISHATGWISDSDLSQIIGGMAKSAHGWGAPCFATPGALIIPIASFAVPFSRLAPWYAMMPAFAAAPVCHTFRCPVRAE